MKSLVVTTQPSPFLSLLLPTPCSPQLCFQAPNFRRSLRGSWWRSYLRMSLPHPPSSFIGHRQPQITKHNFFFWLFLRDFSAASDIGTTPSSLTFSPFLLPGFYATLSLPLFQNPRQCSFVLLLPLSPNFIHVLKFSPRPSFLLDDPLT